MCGVQVPNGELTSKQLRYLGDATAQLGPLGRYCDITTRANIQLRGVTLEHADRIIAGLQVPASAPPALVT